MRTFILRARRVTTNPEELRTNIGNKGHVEIVAHSIMNAFFVSNHFREDVKLYVILDSSPDFPRTIQISSEISINGFHEEAIVSVLEKALRESKYLQKNETQKISDGLYISGFGFEKLVSEMITIHPVYLLDRKGEDIRTMRLDSNPVFILSDHLALPKNSIKRFKREGLKLLSLGNKMLFASQCVLILNYEMDRKLPL